MAGFLSATRALNWTPQVDLRLSLVSLLYGFDADKAGT
jgi:hypothetical protein